MNSDETFEDNRINRALANDQVFAKYQNHYSMQLNRCFYLETLETIKNMKSIEDHPKDPAVHVTMRLSDINENREYALLSRTYLPESVPECSVGDATCHSEEEFRQLIKKYMED